MSLTAALPIHAGRPRRPRQPVVLPLRPGWPLVGLLALYPLWWALGLGVLCFPLFAVPMAALLIRQHRHGRPVRLPPCFGWWLLFLGTVVVSIAALGVDPPATLAAGGGRMIAVGFRLVEYTALTIVLVYAGNLTPAELSQQRLVRLLGWLFVVTVGGGLLGMVAGGFAFASPVELLLPGHLRASGFVQSLVHPAAAQLQSVLGTERPRPAAPWGYTNTWGNNLCLLIGWFVVACWPLARRRRTRLLGAALLVVAIAPVVYSLNRGLWVGLLVMAAYLAARLLRVGRMLVLGGLVCVLTTVGLTLLATPLGGIVAERLEHGKSNGVRLYLSELAIAGAIESPVIGFGSTRDTQGGRNSIAVGETADCERCGNFTIGGNGQLWQVLFAHGAVGLLGYLGFFGHLLWRVRHDRSPIGLAGSAAIVGSFAAMLWYNTLVTPLAFMLLAVALLWRNGERSRTATVVTA